MTLSTGVTAEVSGLGNTLESDGLSQDQPSVLLSQPDQASRHPELPTCHVEELSAL